MEEDGENGRHPTSRAKVSGKRMLSLVLLALLRTVSCVQRNQEQDPGLRSTS